MQNNFISQIKGARGTDPAYDAALSRHLHRIETMIGRRKSLPRQGPGTGGGSILATIDAPIVS